MGTSKIFAFIGLAAGLTTILSACVTTPPGQGRGNSPQQIVVPTPDGKVQTLSYQAANGTWALYRADLQGGNRLCAARGEQAGRTFLFAFQGDGSEHLLIENPALPDVSQPHQLVTLVIENDATLPSHLLHGVLRQAEGKQYLDVDISQDPGASLELRDAPDIEVSAQGRPFSLVMAPSQQARIKARECALLSPTNVDAHEERSEQKKNPFSPEQAQSLSNPFSRNDTPTRLHQFLEYEQRPSVPPADLREYVKLAVDYLVSDSLLEQADTIEITDYAAPDGVTPVAILTSAQGPVAHISLYTQTPTPSIAWFQKFHEKIFQQFCNGASRFEVSTKENGSLATAHTCTFENGDKRIDYQTISPRKGGGYWVVTIYNAGLLSRVPAD